MLFLCFLFHQYSGELLLKFQPICWYRGNYQCVKLVCIWLPIDLCCVEIGGIMLVGEDARVTLPLTNGYEAVTSPHVVLLASGTPRPQLSRKVYKTPTGFNTALRRTRKQPRFYRLYALNSIHFIAP